MLDFAKDFDPNQPRHPEGDPRGGQWTDGGSATVDDNELLSQYMGDNPYKNAMGLNGKLRQGEELTENEQEMAAAVDRKIAAQKPLSRTLTLYRGADRDVFPLEGVVRDPAFVSTTSDLAVADEFASNSSSGKGVIYAIEVPKGMRALDAGRYQAHEGMAYQKEWILPRNARFTRRGSTSKWEGHKLVYLDYLGTDVEKAFNPDQPRDEDGKWTDEGGDESDVAEFIADRDLLAIEWEEDANRETIVQPDHSDNRPGVSEYAGSTNATAINRALRSGKYDDPGRLDGPFSEPAAIRSLTASIEASPPVGAPLTVYRGGSGKVARMLKVGDEFVDKGFVSTSLSRDLASWHARYSSDPAVLEIQVPVGARALSVRGSNEREVILQRGSRFRVARIQDGVISVDLLPAVAKAFDPNQPRAPKGTEIGGQWVDEGGSDEGDYTGAAASIRNGEPWVGVLFRGAGANDARIPSQYAAGEHWTASRLHAGTYGPDVRTQAFALSNPRVWELPGNRDYRSELRAAFGTARPRGISAKLVAAGHDALVVRNVPIQRRSHVTGEAVGGVGAEIILLNSVAKAFDPSQPRAPKGTEEGGQWTSAGGEGELSEEELADLWSEYYASALIKKASTGEQLEVGEDWGTGEKLTAEDVSKLQRAAAQLQAQAQSSTLPLSRRDVWRGLLLEEGADVRAKFKHNSIVTLNGLTAVSHMRDVAEKYTDLQFSGGEPATKVLLRFGRRGGVIGTEMHFGELAGAEAVLPHGSKFRVRQVRKEGDTHIVDLYDTGKLNVAKAFDPNQPRHPKGDERGGQWTSEGGSAGELSMERLKDLRPELAQAAQKEIDEWQQDEEGIDEELGAGGACDRVCNSMSSVIAGRVPDVTIESGGHEGDDHAWLIVHDGKKAYGVDIPAGVYETGSGYQWRKIPDARIQPTNVVIWSIPIGDVVEKYDPSQPRHPKGSEEGGQWTSVWSVVRAGDTYRVFSDDGSLVGTLIVDAPKDGEVSVFNIHVKEEHRRRGVATALYRAAEADYGRLTPSGALSDEGFSFWSKYRPEAVSGDLRSSRRQLVGQKVTSRFGAGRITHVGQSQATATSTGGRAEWPVPRAEINRLLEKPVEKAAPRTLYVKRSVLNMGTIREWAKSQGITSTIPDLHVTLAYSREPVDWDKVEPDQQNYVAPADRARMLERFDEGAVVLRLTSPALEARWQEFKDVGAHWKFDDYRPHVTITYEGASLDLDAIEPYGGPIVFGPEEFDEVVSGGFDPDEVEEVVLKAVHKYDPDQPRKPKGDPEGGRWTSGGGNGINEGKGFKMLSEEIDEEAYHFTSAAGKKSIEAEGKITPSDGILGQFAYLTTDPRGEGTNLQFSSEKLTFRVKSSRSMEIAGFPGMRRFMEANARGDEEPHQTMRRLGVQAFRVTSTGGKPWLVAVDPKAYSLTKKSIPRRRPA